MILRVSETVGGCRASSPAWGASRRQCAARASGGRFHGRSDELQSKAGRSKVGRRRRHSGGWVRGAGERRENSSLAPAFLPRALVWDLLSCRDFLRGKSHRPWLRVTSVSLPNRDVQPLSLVQAPGLSAAYILHLPFL